MAFGEGKFLSEVVPILIDRESIVNGFVAKLNMFEPSCDCGRFYAPKNQLLQLLKNLWILLFYGIILFQPCDYVLLMIRQIIRPSEGVAEVKGKQKQKQGRHFMPWQINFMLLRIRKALGHTYVFM